MSNSVESKYVFIGLPIVTKKELFYYKKHFKKLELILFNLPMKEEQLIKILNFVTCRKTAENNYNLTWLMQVKLLKNINGAIYPTCELINYWKGLANEIEIYEKENQNNDRKETNR